MAITIQVRRGLLANLAGATAADGEPLFVEDVGNATAGVLYVYEEGTTQKRLIGGVETAADHTSVTNVAGRLVFNSTTKVLYRGNGSTWDSMGAAELSGLSGTLDDITDGSSYQKVAATEVDASGYVTQINDGTNVLTAAQGVAKADKVVPAADANLAQLDGTTGNLEDSGVKINDSGSTTADVWTANKIQTEINNAIEGRSWKLPVEVINLIGNLTITGINGLSPSAGDAYVCTDAGTPTAGTSDAMVAGSLAEFDGTSWKEIVAGSGGFVASGVRAILSTTVALISPYTDATDDGKIVAFDGTSLTGADTSDAADGNAVLVKGDDSVYENNQYVFDGTVPTGSWVLINQGGGLTAGNGIDITSSIISVDVDSETGGNIQPANLTSNGVGLDVNAIAGTGVEADGSANLRLAAQGNGIAGGAGSVLSVNPDSTTGATVAPVSVVANGVGVTVDNSSIVHTAGTLSVSVVDGGTF